MDTQDNAQDLGNSPSVVAGWQSIPQIFFFVCLVCLFIIGWPEKPKTTLQAMAITETGV